MKQDKIKPEEQGQIDCEVSDDLVREVEERFVKALFGIPELPQEYPGTYYANYLRAAFDQATAMNLNDIQRLKHCCTVLSKIINDHQTEKIQQALNSR